MVPHVAESPRRVDKTAVLRFSAHGMRIDYGKSKMHMNLKMGNFLKIFIRFKVFGKSRDPCQVRGVGNQLTDALFRLLDTFFLTVTCKGQIVLVSPSIEQHLGHCQVN